MILLRLYLALFLINYSVNSSDINCDDDGVNEFQDGHCHAAKEDDKERHGKKSQGVLIVRGRLGNHLWGYLEVNDNFIGL